MLSSSYAYLLSLLPHLSELAFDQILWDGISMLFYVWRIRTWSHCTTAYMTDILKQCSMNCRVRHYRVGLFPSPLLLASLCWWSMSPLAEGTQTLLIEHSHSFIKNIQIFILSFGRVMSLRTRSYQAARSQHSLLDMVCPPMATTAARSWQK